MASDVRPQTVVAQVMASPKVEAALKASPETAAVTRYELLESVKEIVAAALAMSRPQALPTMLKSVHLTCSTCRQKYSETNPKVGCGGPEEEGVKASHNWKRHRMVAVYPTNHRHGRWFQGLILNGIRYISNSASHRIPVPSNWDAEYMVSQWEQSQDELQHGRVAEVRHPGVNLKPGFVGWGG